MTTSSPLNRRSSTFTSTDADSVHSEFEPTSGLRKVCFCGNVFVDDAKFCRKCGKMRTHIEDALAEQIIHGVHHNFSPESHNSHSCFKFVERLWFQVLSGFVIILNTIVMFQEESEEAKARLILKQVGSKNLVAWTLTTQSLEGGENYWVVKEAVNTVDKWGLIGVIASGRAMESQHSIFLRRP